jgi:crotonobetainyl-CoA:carnitine CoA-transferase CaiB-like acyl-CoA transferase
MLHDSLKGVRVLACEQAVAAPFCSFLMAELGADVIKIERPDGGDVIRQWDDVVSGLSSGFVWVNGGKRDIAVDMSTASGQEIVSALAASADVLIENFAPGVLARWGLGYDRLKADNPGLIYCSLSGYGADGPYRDIKAFDLLIQGESGVLLMNGSPAEPAKVALPLVDLVAGSNAMIGILCALRDRAESGLGTFLDVSMLDSIALWLGYFPHYSWHGHDQPPRSGMRHHRIVPYGPYEARDGIYVNVVAANDVHWRTLCTLVLDRPEWISDPRFATVAARANNRDHVERELERLFASQDSRYWLERLDRSELPHGEVRTIESAVRHPQLIARNMIVATETPVGTVSSFRFALADPARSRHVPGLGEHTDSVLADLGYDKSGIAELRDKGVVR